MTPGIESIVVNLARFDTMANKTCLAIEWFVYNFLLLHKFHQNLNHMLAGPLVGETVMALPSLFLQSSSVGYIPGQHYIGETARAFGTALVVTPK